MELVFDLPDKGDIDAEELLSKQHFYCEYCGQELIPHSPRIYLSYLGPIGSLGPFKEQWRFAFNIDDAVEVGKKFVAEDKFLYVLAHRGLCAIKSLRRNKIITGLSNNNESLEQIESILVDNNIFDNVSRLWEDPIFLYSFYTIWTKNFVYASFEDDEGEHYISLLRNPIIF